MKIERQFRIQDIIFATSILACLFAVARLIGYSGTLFTVGLVYLLGPVFSFGLSRYGQTRNTRYSIAALVLLGILLASYVALSFNQAGASNEAFVFVTLGLWSPQIILISVYYTAWKAGLRSAGIDPYAQRKEKPKSTGNSNRPKLIYRGVRTGVKP